MDPKLLAKYNECMKPAIAWLNKNAPDFVVENIKDGFDITNGAMDLQNKYIKHLEEIKETQYLIIDALEEKIKELEEYKKPF